jgi:CO dehydrogenase maturation factor
MAAVASGLPVAKVTVVADKVRTDVDAEAIAEFCVQHSLALCGLVPWSEAVGDADRARVPVIDYSAAAELTDAVRLLAASQDR